MIGSKERDPLVPRHINLPQVINDAFLAEVNNLHVSNSGNVRDVNIFAQNISDVLCEYARSSRAVREEGLSSRYSSSRKPENP